MSDSPAPIVFRAPSSSKTAPKSPDFQAPSPEFFHATWHVTHSTLPMWKSMRNVRITYTPLEKTPEILHDLVEYYGLTGEKQKTVEGYDTPDPAVPGAYNWRGSGWLKIASSHWEVLAYGEEEGGWAGTFFNKTLFTPAGIDIYSKEKEGLSEALLERIFEAMKRVEDDSFLKLVEGIFEVQRDYSA